MKNKTQQQSVKIKALWLPSWYPHREHPYLGSFTQRDAAAAAAVCEIVVLYAVEGNVKEYELVERIHAEGFIEIVVYFPKIKSNRWVKLFRYLKACIIGVRLIRKKGFRPELIHVHVIWHASLAAVLFQWLYRTPFLVTEHWSGYHLGEKHFRGVHKWMAKYFAARAQAIVTVSHGQATAMQALGIRGNFVNVPNIVDTRNLPSKSPPDKSLCRFIHVSSFDDGQKNISGIFRTVKELSKIRQDFSLTMVGGLGRIPFFRKMVEQLGIGSFIYFAGMLPHEEVMQAYSKADVFLLFSNHEGLPCALLEAMAVGLPAISSNIEGLENWILPKTGILVPIGDEQALLSAMNQMVDRHICYDAMKIRQFITERCSYNVIGKKMERLYRHILRTDS